MKTLKHIFTLIRLPNLILIVLSLYMIRYLILYPAYINIHAVFALSDLNFAFLVLATVFIAAGGYLINDIHDTDTDYINHKQNLINVYINAKAATYIYYIFSFTGFLFGLIISIRIEQFSLAILFLIVIILLYYYAINYKNNPYIKNFIIGLLCAIVILFPVLFEFFALITHPVLFVDGNNAINSVMPKIYTISAFAFLYTFLRELIKDIEDMEGDNETLRQTIPLKYGLSNTKIIAGIICGLILLVSILVYIFLYESHKNIIGYLIICWNIPQIYISYLIYRAKTKTDFHYISSITKITMFIGLCSLFLFI